MPIQDMSQIGEGGEPKTVIRRGDAASSDGLTVTCDPMNSRLSVWKRVSGTGEGVDDNANTINTSRTLPLTFENRVHCHIQLVPVPKKIHSNLHLDSKVTRRQPDSQAECLQLLVPVMTREEEEIAFTIDDVDSRDADPMQNPIHRGFASHPVVARDGFGTDVVTTSSIPRGTGASIWKPRGLTLSAYRRPENTIRLTQSDPSRRIEDDYDLHGAGVSGVLGHGAFSTVRLAVRRRDGMQVAVKTIAKHEALRSRRLRRVDENGITSRHYLEEWEILRRLQDQPHVITLLDVYETEEEIQLVTEYCPGGELFDAIQKRQRRNRRQGGSSTSGYEEQAASITQQILEALEKIHSLNIVHRDVKPENILLAKPNNGESVHVKLCDFGVARPLIPSEEEHHLTVATNGASSVCISSDGEASPLTPGSRSRSFSTVGTDYYAAPELTYGGSYDTAVDIYSLGVTLYILLCGFPPVFSTPSATFLTQDDDSDAEAYEEVLFPDAYWGDVSSGAKALLRRMLHPDPSNRVSAKAAQQDPWITTWTASRVILPPAIGTLYSAVDMDLVRSKLNKSLEQKMAPKPFVRHLSKRRHSSFAPNENDLTLVASRKRIKGFGHAAPHVRRAERRASTTALMALADLYRGVSVPSVFAAAAVAVAATAESENGVDSPSTPNVGNSTHDATFTSASLPLPAESF